MMRDMETQLTLAEHPHDLETHIRASVPRPIQSLGGKPHDASVRRGQKQTSSEYNAVNCGLEGGFNAIPVRMADPSLHRSGGVRN